MSRLSHIFVRVNEFRCTRFRVDEDRRNIFGAHPDDGIGFDIAENFRFLILTAGRKKSIITSSFFPEGDFLTRRDDTVFCRSGFRIFRRNIFIPEIGKFIQSE